MDIQLPSAPITRLQLAELLSISPRTLQRRLKELDTKIRPYKMLSPKDVKVLVEELGYWC